MNANQWAKAVDLVRRAEQKAIVRELWLSEEKRLGRYIQREHAIDGRLEKLARKIQFYAMTALEMGETKEPKRKEKTDE